jgi:hypothetical protein
VGRNRGHVTVADRLGALGRVPEREVWGFTVVKEGTHNISFGWKSL